MLSSDFLETDLMEADHNALDARFDQKIDELHQWAEMLMESLNTQYS